MSEINHTQKVIYVYDGSFEGFLCCVYNYYYNRLKPVSIVSQENFTPSFYDNLMVDTDFEQVYRVRLAIEEKMGYRKCNYCNEADRTEWDYYKDSKPLKTFTVTHRDEFAITEIYNVGNEVNTGYDFEKDKDTLEIDYEEICYMPKSARDFFDENYGDYKMFVLDVYENDNGKVKIKIGIFEELGKNN